MRPQGDQFSEDKLDKEDLTDEQKVFRKEHAKRVKKELAEQEELLAASLKASREYDEEMKAAQAEAEQPEEPPVEPEVLDLEPGSGEEQGA